MVGEWGRKKQKLTGCGNIDKAKGLYETHQRAAAADSEIMLNSYRVTAHML